MCGLFYDPAGSVKLTVKSALDVNALKMLAAVFDGYGVNDPQLWAHLVKVFELRYFTRDQPIIRAGETPTHFFVILSGLIRYYYSSPEGKQRNKAFFHEGEVIGSLSAYLKQQPCTYTIEALEHSWLVAVPLHTLIRLREHFPQLQGFVDKATREIMLRNESREALLLTCNSEERYRWLLGHEAWLLQRVPQYQLASYLSMDPVSFSRIKSKLGA
ncbi:Crp/Fnr family transcriptional regulator [Pseudomonas sp. ZT5P21]